jgi:hypothetical protein
LKCADPALMLEFLRSKASDRKLRLFACACARNIWRFFPGERSRHVVAVSERYADGLATKDDLKVARKRSSHCEASTSRSLAFEAAIETARSAAYNVRLLAIEMSAERAIIEGYSRQTIALKTSRSKAGSARCHCSSKRLSVSSARSIFASIMPSGEFHRSPPEARSRVKTKTGSRYHSGNLLLCSAQRRYRLVRSNSGPKSWAWPVISAQLFCWVSFRSVPSCLASCCCNCS